MVNVTGWPLVGQVEATSIVAFSTMGRNSVSHAHQA